MLAAFGHQEHLVVATQVGDQVVDHAAVLVAAQRVLRLPGRDPAEVVGQAGVDERRSARAADHGLAEVRDVEDADRLADRGVLLEHPAAAGAYSIGISQPPKSASLAPSATCRSCSGECAGSVGHERRRYRCGREVAG